MVIVLKTNSVLCETFDDYRSFFSFNIQANASDKETSFYKIFNTFFIGYNIHTSVHNKRDDFGFPIVNLPWLSVDVPRLSSYVFTFRS